jgi:hypothetical protein
LCGGERDEREEGRKESEEEVHFGGGLKGVSRARERNGEGRTAFKICVYASLYVCDVLDEIMMGLFEFASRRQNVFAKGLTLLGRSSEARSRRVFDGLMS